MNQTDHEMNNEAVQEEGEETKAEETVDTAEECFDETKSEMDLLKEQFDDINDKYLRLMAEYDNYRKRTQKEREDIYPAATATAAGKFLPVLDNLERAEQFEPDSEDFKKGFNMICQSFREVFASIGIEEINAEKGESFNADLHHAVMHVEDPEQGENVIVQVLQKGYRMGDRVIRYAMVQTAN